MGAPQNSSPMMLDDLVVRRVRVSPREVVFLKGVIEASEGVAAVFAESGGDLVIATPPGQEDELDRILQDLKLETGALLDWPPAQAGPKARAE
jgi:Domain of unknown function (DUF4911)